MFTSLSWLVRNGRLGGSFGDDYRWSLGTGSCPVGIVMEHMSLMLFLSLLSAWKCRSCRGATPSASPSPESSCFPKLPQEFPLPSGESPANSDKALKPCVIRPCLPVWPCPSLLILSPFFHTNASGVDKGTILSSPGLCTCHSLFLKHSFHLSSSNQLLILSSPQEPCPGFPKSG